MIAKLRAGVCALAGLVAMVGAPAVARAQEANFNIYVRSTLIGTEQVNLTRSADGWTISSSGRITAPAEVVNRQLIAKYDRNWRPLEFTLDATTQGQQTTLRVTVAGTAATLELSNPTAQGQRRTETIDAQALFLINPFVANFEAVAARSVTATPGTTLFFYQPGQGTFTGLLGAPAEEKIQTVSRVITARRTPMTLQVASQPPLDTEVWADEQGRLLRFRIPAQGLEIAREDMAAVSTRRLTMTRANDENIFVPANGFSLAATVSKPQGASGRLPAVILVPGSGPTDRDEVVSGIAVFGQLSQALADGGYLVVRYDKRGVGQSGGRTESATLVDYAEDTRAVYRAITSRKDVDPRRIALVGHSEGGWLALIAASKDKRIAGVALVAAVGTTGADLNLYQVSHALERANRPEAERQATLDLQRRIQQAVLSGGGWETISVPDAVRRQADTPYFQSFLAFDPVKIIKGAEQPILIVQGALDKQVPADHADKLEAMAKERKNAGPVEVAKIPGVNHLLVQATTGEVDEYPRLSTSTISKDVIASLTSWLGRTLAVKGR